MEKRQRGEIEWRDIRRDRRLNIQSERKEERKKGGENQRRGILSATLWFIKFTFLQKRMRKTKIFARASAILFHFVSFFAQI